jgi:hypothetical protein
VIERRIRGFMVTACAVALLGGAFAGEAHAKKKFIKARINGKGFRAGGIRAAASTNGLGLVAINGSKGTRTLTTLTLGCGFPGLSPASTFPVTAACGGGYAVAGLGAPPKGWVTDDGVQVTIESFDGTTIKGSFSGTFERPGDTNPTDPPASVQGGKFALPLLGG